MAGKRRTAGPFGFSWRILAHKRNSRRLATAHIDIAHTPEDKIQFDELVIDDFLHIEQMNNRAYWARIGDVWMWIWRNPKGKIRVSIRRGDYGDVLGETMMPSDSTVKYWEKKKPSRARGRSKG
jgi:hypothetical protein